MRAIRFQTFSEKQKLAMTWWARPETRELDGILCDGAVRSGKTISCACGFLLWSMGSFSGATFAICGHTIESLRRNVTNLLPRWTEGIFRLEERRSENRITVRCGKRHNDYYLFGGRDESSYSLIQGITLSGVLLDEVALMPRSFVEQAIARCSEAGSKFWFNCNPAGAEHWFRREWVCRAAERHILCLHFTMEDNPALSPAVRERYERLYTGAFYRRYIRGEWCAAEGAVYGAFDAARHICSPAPKRCGRCIVSVDYGTQNPTVFLKWRRAAEGEGWICEAEYYYDGRASQRQKTDETYADDLFAFLQGEQPRTVIVDPSAASFIAVLRSRGLPVQRAENRVADGIRRVNAALEAGTLHFDALCMHTAAEFADYVWDESAAMRGEDRPVKAHDHCMDAVRYFVSTVLARETVHAAPRPRGM